VLPITVLVIGIATYITNKPAGMKKIWEYSLQTTTKPKLFLDMNGDLLCYSSSEIMKFDDNGEIKTQSTLVSPYDNKSMLLFQYRVTKNNILIVIAYNATSKGGAITASIDLSTFKIVDSTILLDDVNKVSGGWPVVTKHSDLYYAFVELGPIAVFDSSGKIIELIQTETPIASNIDLAVSDNRFLIATRTSFLVLNQNGGVEWNILYGSGSVMYPAGNIILSCGFLPSGDIYLIWQDGTYEVRDVKGTIKARHSNDVFELCTSRDGLLCRSASEMTSLNYIDCDGNNLWKRDIGYEISAAYYRETMGSSYFDVVSTDANSLYEEFRLKLYMKHRVKLEHSSLRHSVVRVDLSGNLIDQWRVPAGYELIAGKGHDGEYYGAAKSGSRGNRKYTIARLEVPE
jgi:hypothetical protein